MYSSCENAMGIHEMKFLLRRFPGPNISYSLPLYLRFINPLAFQLKLNCNYSKKINQLRTPLLFSLGSIKSHKLPYKSSNTATLPYSKS